MKNFKKIFFESLLVTIIGATLLSYFLTKKDYPEKIIEFNNKEYLAIISSYPIINEISYRFNTPLFILEMPTADKEIYISNYSNANTNPKSWTLNYYTKTSPNYSTLTVNELNSEFNIRQDTLRMLIKKYIEIQF